MNEPNRRASLGMFIASMLIFGTIGILRRYIPLPSAFLAFSRGILGGTFLLVYARAKKQRASGWPSPRLLLRLALTGALIGVNWMLLFEAYNHTTVAVATLCYYMQPVFVVTLSPILFKERLTGKKAACVLMAMIGMALVSGVIGAGGAQGDTVGILLGLGAAALYAAVILMNKSIQGVDTYQRTTVQLLSAGIIMAPYLLLTGGFRGLIFTPSSLLLLLVVGIVHTGIAYALYFRGMEGLSVQSVAVLSYIDPVAALLFSAFLLREMLAPSQLVGAVLIIGSALASEVNGHRK